MANLNTRTAQTVRWTTADRLATQLLYAAVGVVLANILSKEDFGLIGALAIFQAFATILTDAGMGAALLQKKHPTPADWNTVFWLNLGLSTTFYIILWFSAPAIAQFFHNTTELIPLSRAIFLAFIINGLGIVQSTRLVKQMNVRNLALADIISLTVAGAAAIASALNGAGAWAMVWQSLTAASIKTLWLWLTGHWLPGHPTLKALRSLWRLALSVLGSSALNTFFLHIYSLAIGAAYSMRSLGIYTQADKWAKMGSASLTQIITSTFVPLLAARQDDPQAFAQTANRLDRCTAFIALPALTGLAAVGTPLFHTLFGTKWDAAIPLFQILSLRGIPLVMNAMYNNFLLALGYGRTLLNIEIIKDLLTALALAITIWSHDLTLLVTGQAAASLLTWLAVIIITGRHTPLNASDLLRNLLPAAAATIIMAAAVLCLTHLLDNLLPYWLQLLAAIATGAAVYLLAARTMHITGLNETLSLLRRQKQSS